MISRSIRIIQILAILGLSTHALGSETPSAFEFVSEAGEVISPSNPKPDSTLAAAVRTLDFLKAIPNHDLEKSDFNPVLIGASPFAFFQSRVRKIGIVEDASSDRCSDSRLAYVSPVTREEKKIWICPSIRQLDDVTVASAFIHESRHLDGEEFAHRSCVSGTLKGSLSCDDRYADGGAYAIGLEFLVRLSRNPHVDTKIRQRARQLAIVDFFQRFNFLPLNIRQGALLRAEKDSNLYFYDGEKTEALNLKIANSSRLALRGGVLLKFDLDSLQAKQFAFSQSIWTPASPDVLVQRFQKLNEDQRRRFIDLAYGQSEACLLLSDSLECFGRDRIPFSKNLTGVSPKYLLSSPQTRMIEPGVLYLATNDGQLHRLPPDVDDLKTQPISSWQTMGLPMKSLQPFDGGELALGIDGRLSILSYRTRRWAPAAGAPDFVLRDALAPFYWSKRLDEL